MRQIQMYGEVAAGRSAFIDDGDFDLVSRYRWNCYEVTKGPGRRNYGPYARAKAPTPREAGRGGQVWLNMHCLIMGRKGIDHIDHNGLNNQRSNLRSATAAQNAQNMRPQIGTSSRFRGVTWHKRLRKWQATIKLNGRCIYLGVFTSEEEAAVAYDAAALDAFGEHAYLNLLGDAA